jgi:hypothetical protein
MYYIGFLKYSPKHAVIFKSIKLPQPGDFRYFVHVMGPYNTESAARAGLSRTHARENPASKKESRARYCRERQTSPSVFAAGSFRTIRLGKKKKGVIACPKGHYHDGQCGVSTQLQTILHPVGTKGCPVGGLELKKKKRNPFIAESQIRIGTQHELEHTTDRVIARKIACDHLREDPKYYTHLQKMEKMYKKNYLSDRQALALTKKVVAFGKKLIRHELSEIRRGRKNNPAESHLGKFLGHMKTLEKYAVGSKDYIDKLAEAYGHLKAAKEVMTKK